jgi:Rps23 Pro-64 3,4-dihydroxylase Tpa1-like proline 4-hydroxylase
MIFVDHQVLFQSKILTSLNALKTCHPIGGLQNKTHNWTDDVVNAREYFRNLIESYVPQIYPDLKDNIRHEDNFTLYENGDFITPHKDGYNIGRYCVVLIYLSDEKDYIDGGGKLIIDNGDTKEEVLPIKYNFTILDFTENDINHSVEVVKNNFRRFTYIDFVYNESEYKAWEKTKKNII